MNAQKTCTLFSVAVAFAAIVLSAQAVVSTVGTTEDIYDITFSTRDQFESVCVESAR